MERDLFPIRKKISEVYAHLLPDFFDSPFPVETLATCSDCPMCAGDNIEKTDDVAVGERAFSNRFNSFYSDIKCCTFFPYLPNFLVGAILISKDTSLSEGRQRLEEIIDKGVGVTPRYIQPPHEYLAAYQHYTDYTFGQNRSLLCPYYNIDLKQCSIWQCRQATCATYFCKSVEGVAGDIFWYSVHYYVSHVEEKLAGYAMQQLGISVKNNNEDLSWQEWIHRKEEFYIKSFQIISSLSVHDFDAICGAELADALENVETKYREAVDEKVPEKLTVNPALEYEITADGKYLYDTGRGSCVLSVKVHEVLPFFDGSVDNGQVMKEILQELNIRLRPDFLLKLYKNKLLVAA